jgi:hypothetical protein
MAQENKKSAQEIEQIRKAANDANAEMTRLIRDAYSDAGIVYYGRRLKRAEFKSAPFKDAGVYFVDTSIKRDPSRKYGDAKSDRDDAALKVQRGKILEELKKRIKSALELGKMCIVLIDRRKYHSESRNYFTARTLSTLLEQTGRESFKFVHFKGASCDAEFIGFDGERLPFDSTQITKGRVSVKGDILTIVRDKESGNWQFSKGTSKMIEKNESMKDAKPSDVEKMLFDYDDARGMKKSKSGTMKMKRKSEKKSKRKTEKRSDAIKKSII